MTLKDTVKDSLIMFPSIHKNIIDVYDHLFCTIGNGYEWIDGELKYVGGNERVHTVQEGIMKIFNEEFIKPYGDEGQYTVLGNIIRHDFHREDYSDIKIIFHHNKRCAEYIEDIFNYEDRMNDYSIPMHKNYEFKFYELSKYSAMCCFPDDIKYDWAEGIKATIDFMIRHPETVTDKENLLPMVKERLDNMFGWKF